jgi:FAD/FMN-containing dehydrogenase
MGVLLAMNRTRCFRESPVAPQDEHPDFQGTSSQARQGNYQRDEHRQSGQDELEDQSQHAHQLLNEGVEVFENRQVATTDILQEYFVPLEQLEPFLERVRVIIPSHHADLLNVTIRFLHTDHESFLRYADQDMFALVMLFHQPRTQQADQTMAEMTREVIEAALQSGGRYYLPYRLHATHEQFSRCYPQAQRFFELKRQYDPEELFQNELYRKYGIVESKHA